MRRARQRCGDVLTSSGTIRRRLDVFGGTVRHGAVGWDGEQCGVEGREREGGEAQRGMPRSRVEGDEGRVVKAGLPERHDHEGYGDGRPAQTANGSHSCHDKCQRKHERTDTDETVKGSHRPGHRPLHDKHRLDEHEQDQRKSKSAMYRPRNLFPRRDGDIDTDWSYDTLYHVSMLSLLGAGDQVRPAAPSSGTRTHP